MVQTETHPRLATPDDSVTVLAAENVRGFDVHDRNNQPVGKVDDVVIDTRAGRVRFLKVGDGGFLGIGRTCRLVPVDIVKGVTGDYVFLDETRERVSGGPIMRSLENGDHLTEVVRYYGCQPFWSSGYRQPDWTRPE